SLFSFTFRDALTFRTGIRRGQSQPRPAPRGTWTLGTFQLFGCRAGSQYAHRLRVHWARGVPRPLLGEGERFRQDPGRVAPRRLNVCLQVARDGAAFSTVIVRLVRSCALERTIQYSRASAVETICPGVLDALRANGSAQ